MSNLAADRNTLFSVRKAPRTLDSLIGHACQLTVVDLTFFVRTLIQNSFILKSHKMKNNALNAFDQQNQSLTT